MEKHEQFRDWALEQGVKLNGVAAHRFPGRGLGIIATEKAKVDHVSSSRSSQSHHDLVSLYHSSAHSVSVRVKD